MDARTIEPSLQLPNLTNPQVTDRLSNIPISQLEINDHLGAMRGLFYAVVFQGVLGLILFAGWGLWHVLR